MFEKTKQYLHEFPLPFKILVVTSFIDRLGSFMLFPFFGFYITDHFQVGVMEFGILFTLFSVGGLFGGILGGLMTDKLGRKVTLLFGLVISGLSSLFMPFIDDLGVFYTISLFLGLFGGVGGPAQQAMVADLIPQDKRADGYGALRIAVNLSATVGPSLGALLVTQGYMYLFFADALSSIVTAIIVFRIIPESQPQHLESEAKSTSFIQTIKGYGTILKDVPFMLFFVIQSLEALVYMQLNSSLSVFLRDYRGFPETQFGLLLSLNAVMVVIFQIPITRLISKYRGLVMISIGVFLYAIGFVMYGFVYDTWLIYGAMVIITIGEMIIAPFSQTIVAEFAPEDKRGRYMGFFSLSYAIPSLYGVVVAGYIIDYGNPNLVWYLAGIISVVASMGFLGLEKLRVRRVQASEKNDSSPDLNGKEIETSENVRDAVELI